MFSCLFLTASLNPIPTSQGPNQPLYERQMTKSGWNRVKWILDIIWPLNQHFKLKNQRNWLQQVSMLKYWSVINRFFMHWAKKLTLITFRTARVSLGSKYYLQVMVSLWSHFHGFRKAWGTSWKNHKFLHSQFVSSMSTWKN